MLWDITMQISVRGVGNLAAQQKVAILQVEAPDIAAAVAAAPKGIVTVKVLKAVLTNPADVLILPDTQVP